MKNKSRAFSLIELSIVILIIGILIAGVTQASRLVRESKLKTAQTLTKSSPVAGIPGLALWLEPTLDESFAITGGVDQTEEGTTVNQWNDINPQTSSKYFMNSTTTAGAAPTYSLSAGANGLPSLSFPQSTSQLVLSSNAKSNSNQVGLPIKYSTYFIVYSGADEALTVTNASATTSPDYTVSYYSVTRSFSINGTSSTSDESVQTTTVAEIASIDFDTTLSVYINGDVTYSSSAPAITTVGGANTGTFSIATRTAIPANVSEVIVFDRALKNEERQSVEEYLGKKYGIKVVKNTPND